MTTPTETEKELRDLIVQFREETRISFERVNGELKALNERLNGIDTRLNSLEARVNAQTNWFIGLFGVLVTGLLGLLSKVVFFSPNI